MYPQVKKGDFEKRRFLPLAAAKGPNIFESLTIPNGMKSCFCLMNANRTELRINDPLFYKVVKSWQYFFARPPYKYFDLFRHIQVPYGLPGKRRYSISR